MESEVLAKVIRGETVESEHRGHFIVIDGNGRTAASAGDPTTVTFFRSAAKPFQAIPFITSGAADAFGFGEDELALACASHSGEPAHVEIVAGMLARIGMTEADLRCGVHAPFFAKRTEQMLRQGETPTQLHNNCSGKHAAMLAFAKHIGADTAAYEAPDNRIQQRILRCMADFTREPESGIKIAVDGCAAPNFAVPVAAMATSFANLVAPMAFPEPTQQACSRIVAAMTRYPELIGGSERLDTMLMQAAAGRIVSKVGADGVWLCGVLPSETWPMGLGIALKVADGDDLRARPVVAVQLLRSLGILKSGALADVSPMPIKNRRGDLVGMVKMAQPMNL